MGAKKRCSNCEKSVDYRTKEGRVYVSLVCKSSGEKIANSATRPDAKSKYYQIRRCEEFIARPEYLDQFANPLDKAMEMIEKGKKIRDIVDPL